MQINKNNYEIFFLDYWENRLGKQEKTDLSRFLEQNPDLQDEFLDFEDSVTCKVASPNKVSFPEKGLLKKTEVMASANIHQDNYEEHIIAHLEGDHSHAESEEFIGFLSRNPQISKEIELYRKTFLTEDNPVVFENKNLLKRRSITGFQYRIYYLSAVAALLAIFLLIFNPFRMEDPLIDQMANEVGNEMLMQTEPTSSEDLAGRDGLLPQDPIAKMEQHLSVQLESRVPQDIHLEKKSGGFNIKPNQEVPSRAIQMAVVSQIPVEYADQVLIPALPGKLDLRKRSELTEVFDDMLLKDALAANEEERRSKSAFGRVLANIGQQIFGDARADESGSLLSGMAELGRERISEFAENSPRFKTVEQEGKKETFFAINENFSIRIKKAGKNPGSNE